MYCSSHLWRHQTRLQRPERCGCQGRCHSKTPPSQQQHHQQQQNNRVNTPATHITQWGKKLRKISYRVESCSNGSFIRCLSLCRHKSTSTTKYSDCPCHTNYPMAKSYRDIEVYSLHMLGVPSLNSSYVIFETSIDI